MDTVEIQLQVRSDGKDWAAFGQIYTDADAAKKQLEENARFAELARQELAAQRKDNFWRQERLNVSLQARGNNHDRKVHCARIKARKGWR